MPHIYSECRTYITHPAHISFLAAHRTFEAAHITSGRTYITFRRIYIHFSHTYIIFGRTHITFDFIFSIQITTWKAAYIDLKWNLFAQKYDFWSGTRHGRRIRQSRHARLPPTQTRAVVVVSRTSSRREFTP